MVYRVITQEILISTKEVGLLWQMHHPQSSLREHRYLKVFWKMADNKTHSPLSVLKWTSVK